MFSKAVKIASGFTHPAIVSHRLFDGSVGTSIGAFVIINPEGWILTCAHLVSGLVKFNADAPLIAHYKNEVDRINNDDSIPLKKKKSVIDKLTRKADWVKNWAAGWSRKNYSIGDAELFEVNDLAIAKLINYDPNFCPNYPVFKNPKNLLTGTSLCKLGYPFSSAESSFNEVSNSFDIKSITTPFFPMDGIYTRDANGIDDNGKIVARFLETSTPGLRGQSGGPTFDVHGNIWAIQSSTKSLPLGFKPKTVVGKKEVEEHQFINVGMGIHIKMLLESMDKFGIKYQLSEE